MVNFIVNKIESIKLTIKLMDQTCLISFNFIDRVCPMVNIFINYFSQAVGTSGILDAIFSLTSDFVLRQN